MAVNLDQHVYEVVVVNTLGVPYGQITNAVPTQVGRVLDDLGAITFEFPVLETGLASGAELLPMTDIPAGREVQVWRDNVLVAWGVPVSAVADRAKVTVQCSGLLWYLRNLNFGPPSNIAGFLPEYLVNPDFEDGLTGWTAGADVPYAPPTVTTQSTTVLKGTAAAQLDVAAAGVGSFLEQNVVVSTVGGQSFDLSGWFYSQSQAVGGPNAPLDNRGLFIRILDNFSVPYGTPSFAPMDESAVSQAFGEWTRLEIPGGGIHVPAGSTNWTLNVRLYAPYATSYWDDIHLQVPQSIGSTSFGGDDVSVIIANVMAYANDPSVGKWNMGIPFDVSSPMTGVILERHYQFSDNQEILAAINEFPSIAAADFAVVWPAEPAIASETAQPARMLTVFAPAQGAIKQAQVLELGRGNFTDMSINVDGTTTHTAQRLLGQGSSGTAQEFGFAIFPSYIGGRVVEDGVIVAGSTTVTSATAGFVATDVGEGIYCLAPGALAVGTVIAAVGSATSVTISLPAVISVNPAAVGVGGVVLDNVASALVNQPVGILSDSAAAAVRRTMRDQPIPSIRVKAADYLGQVDVGDVVPAVVDYGWIQLPPQYMRVVALNLYPVTDELEFILNNLLTAFPEPVAPPPPPVPPAPELMTGGYSA